MKTLIHKLSKILILAASLALTSPQAETNPNKIDVPVLVYHNFDPAIPGSMTISTQRFEEQLVWLRDQGYRVIPLKKLVSYLQGEVASLPEKSVVITADDGKKSVHSYMLPLVKKYSVPVTLFIYPSAISNASYALTWPQLQELQQTGLFDIQGHTYWHPNFNHERKRLSPQEYQKFIQTQLVKSKQVLEKKLNINVTLLAWPYGIYNDELESAAAKAGYTMAFSIDGRPANKSEKPMAQPRYLIVASESMETFATIIKGKHVNKSLEE